MECKLVISNFNNIWKSYGIHENLIYDPMQTRRYYKSVWLKIGIRRQLLLQVSSNVSEI
jgi:hypothetical protein